MTIIFGILLYKGLWKNCFSILFLDLLYNLITKCVQNAIFYSSKVAFIILTNTYSVYTLFLPLNDVSMMQCLVYEIFKTVLFFILLY